MGYDPSYLGENVSLASPPFGLGMETAYFSDLPDHRQPCALKYLSEQPDYEPADRYSNGALPQPGGRITAVLNQYGK